MAANTPPQDDRRDHLDRLVRERRAELGPLSLAKVAAASGDPELQASWISRLERGQVRDIPDRARLEALARGLQLPARRVLRAASEQYFGLDETGSEDDSVVAVIDHMAEMSDAEKRQLSAMVEAFARSRHEK